MPTLITSRVITPTARLRTDIGPFLVVVLLSLLFALGVWSAFAPNPMPNGTVAAAQIGL